MEKDFLDFPIIEVNGIKYIEVWGWNDAKTLVELFNSSEFSKFAIARFPEHKHEYAIGVFTPFLGFKSQYWYIHLCPKF